MFFFNSVENNHKELKWKTQAEPETSTLQMCVNINRFLIFWVQASRVIVCGIKCNKAKANLSLPVFSSWTVEHSIAQVLFSEFILFRIALLWNMHKSNLTLHLIQNENIVHLCSHKKRWKMLNLRKTLTPLLRSY
jgi:hypothetical protein